MDSKDTHSRLELMQENKNLIDEIFQMEQDGHKDAREIYSNVIAGYLVRTDDGSFTLTSDKRDNQEAETLHSRYGAITESYEKFVKPSNLLEVSKYKDTIRVLDICSGIGYNVAALLNYMKDEEVEIVIDMIESSVETLATSLFIPDVTNSYTYIKKAVESYLLENEYLKYNMVLTNVPSNIHININVCDARDFIKNNAEGEYDAVFLDPYSPSKSPELYSIDFFKHLYSHLTSDALILTYTAASPVRSALIHAGFHVGEGPRFHRSGGTVASKNAQLIETPLSFSDEKVIALSDVGIPFIDPDLDADFDTIVNRRQSTRQKIRGVSVFPSSSKLPRFLGVNPDSIENEALRDKLNNYVRDMGFDSVVDERILEILDIDEKLPSSNQVLQLEENLKNILSNN